MILLIIDDHESFLNAVAGMIRQMPGIESVYQAVGGRRGLELAAELKPSTVLVDFSMPEVDGLTVTRTLKASPNPPRVVVMSFHSGPEYHDMAIGAGADAFLPKTELHSGLAPLLQRFKEARDRRPGD